MNKMNKMNKMKRFLIAVMVAIMFGSSFVSCIDSEVSPEIKKIYQGHADLLASQSEVNRAEVALKAAEAVLITAQAALETANAAVQKAGAARIVAETSSNVTAAEVAVRKAEAEIARMLAETASGVVAAEVAVKKAEAEIAKMLADLLKAQQLHANVLRDAGFAAAEALFAQYTRYRGLAGGKLVARKTTAKVLRDELKALATGKIDSVVNKASLASLRALKTAAEVGLQATQTALTAAKNGESATQKADFDARVKAYNDSIAKIAIDIALKKNEKTNEQAKLDVLTGTTALRTEYNRLAGLIKADSTLYKNKKKSVKKNTKTLENYDAEKAKLKDKVTDVNTKHDAAEAERKAYNTLKDDVGVFLDSLTITTEALKTHIAAKTDIEGIRKTVADARKLHDSLKDIYDADPAGPSIFAGPDGTLGNHGDDPAVTQTFRQIISVATITELVTTTTVTNGITTVVTAPVTKTTPVFGAIQYFTRASIPPKTAATTTSVAVPAEVLALMYNPTSNMFTNIDATSVGKYVDVEADDKIATLEQKNFTKFNAAVIALDAAIRELNASKASLADDSATEEKLRDKIAKFDKLLVDNAGVTLKAKETSFINALKAIGIKVSTTVIKDSILNTNKAAITAKKNVALVAPKRAVANFPTKEKLKLDNKLLGIDIVTIAAKIAGNTTKLTALEAEIESASNVEGVSELITSINAIEAEIADLEASKTLMELLKSQYDEVSALISVGLDALKTKVNNAVVALTTATDMLVEKEKIVSSGWFDRAASTELIWVLKLELAAMDAEILELIGLANKYKALAEAALEAAITA